MRRCLFVAAALVCALAASAARGAATPAAAADLTIEFDPATRTVRISDREAGPVLDGLVVKARVGGREVSSDGKDSTVVAPAAAAQRELTVSIEKTCSLVLTVRDGGIQVRVDGKLDGPASLLARPCVGPRDVLIAILQDEAPADRGVLVSTLGPAEVPGAASLFDVQRDLALTAAPAGRARWTRAEGWELRSTAPAGEPLLALRVRPHYYRDTLGIKFYAPMKKLPRWPTAPVVAMTWYGIEAMNGRPAQTKERLFPQIDWVAEHLLPYAGPNLVFQLDDNYPERDDRVMQELADYIRSKGLVPGIWFTPFAVTPKGEEQKHPDWFLHDAQGKFLQTFGGINYGVMGGGRNVTLNVTRPEAIDTWYAMWWRKASDTWKYEFFKIDGQPDVVDAYRKAADGGGIEGYRKALEMARRLVGPAKFINACWGTPVEAIGLVNGSRTGGDTGYDPHAANVILEWNFLNNVVWWSDPDAAAMLHKATVERVRLNALARVLTGQQFLTDDLWTKVPPEVCRVWQQSFPTLDIRPVNLYPIKEWRKYDTFDLRVAKPWATYDVVGLFNFDGRPAAKTLDLARLPLASDTVHVYDFWRSAYLGLFPRDATIPCSLAAYEGRLFSAVPAAADDRPVLISTSRHLSQGGLDLEQLTFRRDGPRWIAAGRSSHLVKGDPYELVFAAGRHVVASATSAAGKTSASRSGGAARVSITPDAGGPAEWEVAFEPAAETLLDVLPPALELPSGATRQIEVRSAGPRPARFKARSSDPRVHLSPAEGALGPWPAKTTIAVSVDASALEPGGTLAADVTIEAAGAKAPPSIPIRVHAPPPENLALKAEAKASSAWAPAYDAAKAVDGDPSTRWNSREGDKDGCWIELAWAGPVEFNRIIVDECMDYGPRIQAWKLLAGSGNDLVEIARGQDMGARRTINLAKPVEARRLRLVIEKAAVVPTIWEIKVQRVK